MSLTLDALESDDNCVLYALDETSIRVEPDNRRLWSPIGVSPILEHNASHKGVNAIGATEILKNFDTIIDLYPSEKSITSVEIKTFLEHLVEINPGKKVYVVWDNARTHTSKMMQSYLSLNSDDISTINLPRYSPTMNPQENLWNRLKTLLFRPSSRSCIEELYTDIFNIYNEFNMNISSVRSLTLARSFLV